MTTPRRQARMSPAAASRVARTLTHRDWSLPDSVQDLLIGTLKGLDRADLEAIRLYAERLAEAADCVLLLDMPLQPSPIPCPTCSWPGYTEERGCGACLKGRP